MTIREPRWDIDLRRGQKLEQHVDHLLTELDTVECKLDEAAAQTGNVYIEHACKHADGAWHDSGIAVSQAKFWAIGIGSDQLVLIVPTPVVRALWQEAIDRGAIAECHRGSHPTKGVRIPLRMLLHWASAKCRRAA